MTARLALEADAEGIARVYIGSLRDAFGGMMPADFQHEADVAARAAKIRTSIATSERAWFVSVSGGDIVGFCAISSARDTDLPEGFGEITAVGLDRTHRRHGHGRRLLDAARADAARRGWRGIVLWVVAENADSRAFYERCGFTADGTTRSDDRLGFSASVVRYRG